jgi:hypothetical protein
MDSIGIESAKVFPQAIVAREGMKIIVDWVADALQSGA